MKRAAAKIVLKLLNLEQNKHRMDIAQEMLAMFNDHPDLLKKVKTGDETFVYGDDIEPMQNHQLNTVSLIHFFE